MQIVQQCHPTLSIIRFILPTTQNDNCNINSVGKKKKNLLSTVQWLKLTLLLLGNNCRLIFHRRPESHLLEFQPGRSSKLPGSSYFWHSFVARRWEQITSFVCRLLWRAAGVGLASGSGRKGERKVTRRDHHITHNHRRPRKDGHNVPSLVIATSSGAR